MKVVKNATNVRRPEPSRVADRCNDSRKLTARTPPARPKIRQNASSPLENFSTGLLAFCLIFGLAGGVRAVNFRESLHLSATLLGSGLLTFVAFFTTFMGPAHVASA